LAYEHSEQKVIFQEDIVLKCDNKVQTSNYLPLQNEKKIKMTSITEKHKNGKNHEKTIDQAFI